MASHIFNNKREVLRTVMRNQLFASSRRKAIKIDCRKKNIDISDSDAERLQFQLKDFVCGVITPEIIYNSNKDDIVESPYSRALYDVIYSGHFNDNDTFNILVTD